MVATLTEQGPQPGFISACGQEHEINREFFNRRFMRSLKAKVQQMNRQAAKDILDQFADDDSTSCTQIKNAAISNAVSSIVGFDDISNALQDPDVLGFVISKACNLKIEKAEEVADDCDIMSTVLVLVKAMGLDEIKNSDPRNQSPGRMKKIPETV